MNKNAPFSVCRGRQTTARGGCNVHQLTPKIQSKAKKCANQNGRPSRSLKSKKNNRKRKKETRARLKRREDDIPIERHVVGLGIVPSHSEIASSF